jgi:hypothetical protein
VLYCNQTDARKPQKLCDILVKCGFAPTHRLVFSMKNSLLVMNTALIIASSLLVLCGCSGVEQSPVADSIARSLAKTWPRANPHLELTMQAIEINGRVVLRGALKNTSDGAVTINRSRLPWTSPSWLSVNVIAANGEIPRRPPVPAAISVIEAGPSQIVLNPGDILEGDVDLLSGPLIPVGEPPSNIDILLLWSYSLYIGTAGENPFFSGITFLKRRS